MKRLARILNLTWALSSLSIVVQAGSPLSVIGITTPFREVTLSAPVAGTVTKRCYEEGDFVPAGKTIVELDKKLEELTVARRKLVMDALKVELEGTRLVVTTTKSISKDDLLKKELEYNVAAVDYDTAIEQLRKRQIASPEDGFITHYFLETGEDCRPQEPVVKLVEIRRVYFVANIDAKLGTRLRLRQKIKLEIESGATALPVEGAITYISPVVDAASGLLRIKVLFENPDNKIRPGVNGRMFLELDNS